MGHHLLLSINMSPALSKHLHPISFSGESVPLEICYYGRYRERQILVLKKIPVREMNMNGHEAISCGVFLHLCQTTAAIIMEKHI
jgi:hypothetical protein